MEPVAVLMHFRRLRWLGHLWRMNDDRLPKQLLFGSLPKADSVGPGRPLKGWVDYVREDLVTLGMPYDWCRIARDREKWRSRIQKLLTHT